MNAGPERKPTTDLLDFMRHHWLDGDQKILFNTLANVDLQRRVFSHGGNRIDIVGPSTGTDHAEQLLAKIPQLVGEGGCFSFPVTEDKMTQIYQEFDQLAKDLTEHPNWDEFWRDWEQGFEQAIRANPEGYLKEEQLKQYQLDKNAFLRDFIAEKKPEVQTRVKGGYCFKMLTELLANPKIPKEKKLNKDISVVLQTISNHKDTLDPGKMCHYVNDGYEKRLQNRLKSTREELFLNSPLHDDPEATLDKASLLESINKLINGYDIIQEVPDGENIVTHRDGVIDSDEYQKLDVERRENLIHDLFKSESALTLIMDDIENRALFKKYQSAASDYLKQEGSKLDPEHVQKLKLFMDLASRSEVGQLGMAIDFEDLKETLKDKEALSELCANLELLWAHEHLNRQLDSFIQNYTHGIKSKDDLANDYHQISANDNINTDHAPVAYMVDRQVAKLLEGDPNIDTLRDLRRTMEEDPSDENRQAYYDAIQRAKQLPESDLNASLTIASVRDKWTQSVDKDLTTYAGNFMEEAPENFKLFGPPMTSEKMGSLCREMIDLNDNLLDSSEFRMAINSMPESVREKSQSYILAELRRLALSRSDFLKESDLPEDAKAKFKSNMMSIFEKVNQKIGVSEGIDPMDLGRQIYEEMQGKYKEILTDEVSKQSDRIRKSVLDGKSMTDAVAEIDGELAKLMGTEPGMFLGETATNKILEPLQSLQSDYKEIYDSVNEQLQSIGSQFVPKKDKESSEIVQDLIAKATDNITQLEAFQRRPHVGQIALQRHILSEEAQASIKENAAKARTNYFAKHFTKNTAEGDFKAKVDNLINSKKNGLKWIRFHPARREVISRLVSDINQGKHNFDKRNAFQKFFGVSLTDKQQTAIKALQKEFVHCLKIELAQCATNKEAVALLESVKDHELLKPVGKTSLFEKKDKSAQKEFNALLGVLKASKEGDKPSSLPILENYEGLESDKKEEFSYLTSPEFDVVDGLTSRLSIVLKEEESLQRASQQSLQEHERKVQVNNLKDPNKHSLILDYINGIEDPKRRMGAIESLFAMAHNNSLFEYHDRVHLQHKQYGPVQTKAIEMLQDAYVEALRQEMFKQVWMCADGHFDPDVHQYRGSDFDFSAENLHPLSFPKEMRSDHKSQIFKDLLGPAKGTPIMSCQTQDGRVDSLKAELSNITQILNHMYDPGTPDWMRQQLDNDSKKRLGQQEDSSQKRQQKLR